MDQAKKRISLLALCVMLAFALAGCGDETSSQSQEMDDSLQRVLDAGELIIGLDEGFPPMGFTNEKGEVVGFDIDMAQEVCNRLGVKLVKQGIKWSEKEERLNDGTIDCIWNGLSITPARADAMCLSNPYMKNELLVVVPNSSNAQVLRDLEGYRIGVQEGATARDVLESTAINSDIKIQEYPTVSDILDGLETGEMDAALIDSVSAFYFIFSNDKPFFILSESLAEEDYAIGFRKGEEALRDKVQELLSEMKADGTLGKISKVWFGSDITTVR